VCEATGNSPVSGPLGTDDRHNRVLIVDDHAPFRSIARQVLTADGFLVVAEAADGAEAIRACDELRPDLVLLDVQLPDIDGFAVAAVLTTRIDPPAVVLVSSRSRTDYGSRISDCGARGYIAKGELSGDAVRRLLQLPNEVPPLGSDPRMGRSEYEGDGRR
jgi:DNA-binding NarL/FixJ family response regulator